MTFLHPWALYAGLAALGVPLVVHWLTRPRPTTLPFSAIRFLREAVRQRRAFDRLRDFIVLALRGAALLLLAWAIGRPLWGTQPLVQPDEAGQLPRVILLDVSHSMAAQADGVQVFQRARALAAEYLPDEPNLRANVILIGARPRAVFGRLSSNAAALREEVGAAEPRPERADVQAAVNLAGEMLAGFDRDTPCEVVVISDFQRANWSGVDFAPLPAGAKIQMESVAPNKRPDNLAILKVAVSGRAEDGHDTRLEIDVGNYTQTSRTAKIDIALESGSYRAEGVCPPGTTTLSIEAPVRGAGWQAGEASLVGNQDVLPGDDRRPFVLNIRSAPRFALITRESPETRPSSSYFLERALAAGTSAGAKGRIVHIHPDAWDRETLDASSLLLLDHPGTLTKEQIADVTGAVRRGRGLLVVAAEARDAETLRQIAGTLGTSWQAAVDFAEPPAGQRRKDLFLVDIRKNAAPFDVFGEQAGRLFGGVRLGGGLVSRRLERGLADEVAAGLSDGSAFLLITRCGAGRVGVLNTDPLAGNLPAATAFVPLLNELAAALIGGGAGMEEFTLGEPVTFVLPADAGPASGLRVEGDDPGQLIDEASGAVWRSGASNGAPSGAAGKPGVTRIQKGPRTVFAAAGTISPEESDLSPLDLGVLRGRLAGERQIFVRSAIDDDHAADNLWIWLAIGCLLCLIGEAAALAYYRT